MLFRQLFKRDSSTDSAKTKSYHGLGRSVIQWQRNGPGEDLTLKAQSDSFIPIIIIINWIAIARRKLLKETISYRPRRRMGMFGI